MRVLVLINPGAGTAEGEDGLIDRLKSLFGAHGIEAELQLVAGDELAKAAEAARGCGAVVTGGGDGSINAAAAALAGTGVPLGILPLGTRNHFAKDLGLPLDLDAAVATIARAHAVAVDVGEVNGRVFINNSSVGIYPFLVLDRERRQSAHGLAKWSAMALAALRALWQFPRRRLRIIVEGRSAPHRTPCVFVGNNEYSLHPPELGERSRLDGGELWVCVAKQESRLALLWLAVRALFGRVDPARDLDIARAVTVEVHARTSRLPVSLDGDVEIMRPPLRYHIRPGALRVFGATAPRAASTRHGPPSG